MYSELTPIKQKHQLVCPICGSQDYDWGYMYATGYQSGERFNMWQMKNRLQVMKIRRCKVCDNVQQFLDPEVTKRVNTTTVWVVVIVLAFVFLIFVTMLVMTPMY
jgi:predicted nucleic-acid-binding Zn-ribbon protein